MFKITSIQKFILLTFLATSGLHVGKAAETDAFTSRYDYIADAMPAINAEVNHLVRNAVALLQEKNRNSAMCSWKDLDNALGYALRRPLRGRIEELISTDPGIPHFSYRVSESIYRSTPAINRLALEIGYQLGIGFAAHIRHNGLIIGADKFGHFLDEGYYYYALTHLLSYSLEDAMRMGDFFESTLEGTASSGIYSYADLAANYDGYFFWRDALGTPEDRSLSKYFSCESGRWQITRPIDLGAYVTEAWDEGMNCSGWRSQDLKEAVEGEIQNLEKTHQRRYACPVYPDRVQTMVDHYDKAAAAHIIQPMVLESLWSTIVSGTKK